MSDPIGTYTFIPWVRQGLANRIGSMLGTRPTVKIALDIEGTNKGGGTTTETVEREVELYGPGDVIGIDPAQISRVEPANWVTNFEPNYLAAIEFYDEDFPWRYTPAAPADRRLLPWLSLIVLEETTEFRDGRVAGRPLPYVEVTADFADVFPDASECWAWAHAHFNAAFSDKVFESDGDKVSAAAAAAIGNAPDAACSRLLCPRKLKPKTSCHAFLVPAFESGRLAGLGIDQKPLFDDPANGLAATSSSWGAYGDVAKRPDPASFPFYHRWYFRTAENGDFESLVRLLKPKIVDSRVGHRDIDVSDPAPNIAGVAAFDGVLRLGGALKAPLKTMLPPEKAKFEAYDKWATPYPHEFQKQLAAFVNLADGYQKQGTDANADPLLDATIQADPDPLITPPIYGRWHALTERLLTAQDGSDVQNRENWVHDLNLDPRWRVAAGFGTKVVQDNQESYMDAAWDQIGDVLEANRKIRQAQLAKLASQRLHESHLQKAAQVSPAVLLLKMAPLKARIVSEGLTVHHRLGRSHLGTAMTSSAMRRAIRPGATIIKRLGLTDPHAGGDLISGVNAGTISAAPPKEPPTAILTPDDLANAAAPPPAYQWLVKLGQWLLGHPFLAALILLLLLVLLFRLLGAGPVALVVAAFLVALAIAIILLALKLARQQAVASSFGEAAQTPGSVGALPGSSGFSLVTPVDPRDPVNLQPLPKGQTDNEESKRFKRALLDQRRLIDASRLVGTTPGVVPIDIAKVGDDMLSGTQPGMTIPRWVWSSVVIPERIRDQMGEDFVEVMAYPEFDTAMYEPLVKSDKEGFVPNLNLVEPDSVTLLETNQRFIEAYMVGINHEFARELLWREYPTDQRGSYFRQFWDVRKKIAEAADKKKAREKYKDIKPIHRWPPAADLGDNDNREVGPQPEEELVLVVRGELLKKYPNTIISAQRAKWQLKDGKPDKTKERLLDDRSPPIFPLYEARVAPDIYFFGFDLKAEVARGDDTVDNKPGWFFRIEEVPGDARFGFDISREAGSQINVWNDLAWPDVMPGIVDGKNIKIASIPPRTLTKPTGTLIEKRQQWESDRHVPLNAQLSAAEFAYIALQTPVIMAVHASELLPNQDVPHA